MSLSKENIDFLIALCKEKNRVAQEELYNRFYKAMYHTAFNFVKDPMLAEDIMQEGFITAFEKLDQYQGGGTFPGWIKKIVVHKSLEHLKQKKTVSIEAHENGALENIMSTAANEAPAPERNIRLLEALEQLHPNYQNLLKLYYLEGFDYEEIGTILNMSYTNCRTTLSRAREQLKAKLEAK